MRTYLFLTTVRIQSIEQRHNAREGPRWGAHEESGNVREAQRCGESGEEGVEGKADNVGSKRDHHEVNLDILDGHDEAVIGSLFGSVHISLSHVLRHAELGDVELFLGEATRVGGKIGQDKGGRNGDGHGDCSLD